MNKLKKFVALAAVLCMLPANTYAEMQYVSEKVMTEGENISNVEENMLPNAEPSDVYVNVVKEINGQQTIIYSGMLSGYDNGAFADVDFSDINFMVVFNWDSNEAEEIHIIPATMQTTVNATLINNVLDASSQQENTVELQSTSSTATTIQTNMALMYNNKYCESVILPGQMLTIPVTITNTGSTLVEIIPYIAKYDLSGRLTDLIQGDLITAPANQKVSANVLSEFNTDTACTAKVFFWQKNNMNPVADSVYLTIQNQDYYSDIYAEANRIDIDKQLCGVINTSTDVDIVKFIPETTGVYALQFIASSNTICGIYDSTQSVLNSVSAVEDKNYLLYSLTANEEYYIRINGIENNTYEFTPALPNESITLTRNIGSESSFSDNNDFDVYNFVPETSGCYIITAVESSDVTAEVYNSSFERIASADLTDESVSFRITYDMIENEEYYVVVYPKSENDMGTYTLYVEEPLALISVE